MNSYDYAHLAQIIVAVSVGYVWVFRFDNIVEEFKQYGLGSLTRTMVGASKIILATLLVAGIWYPALVLIPALLMGFLMAAAQYYHFKVHNPWSKRVPSLVLLVLCVFVAAVSSNLLS
ncbi:DoxX family protein [Hymenobacter sp.]|uniref:DoxX family protein n=1 Tax=Hymenobacter sp. TaxID=1898978 RepID=UPI00286AF7E5|nr:DoxX family protein [Hymenobacter sp.]